MLGTSAGAVERRTRRREQEAFDAHSVTYRRSPETAARSAQPIVVDTRLRHGGLGCRTELSTLLSKRGSLNVPPNSTVLERNAQKASVSRAGRQAPVEALDREMIADMSSSELDRMSHSELARVVRASPLPPLRARLEYLDRTTQIRLAHLACLCCRNRK